MMTYVQQYLPWVLALVGAATTGLALLKMRNPSLQVGQEMYFVPHAGEPRFVTIHSIMDDRLMAHATGLEFYWISRRTLTNVAGERFYLSREDHLAHKAEDDVGGAF